MSEPLPITVLLVRHGEAEGNREHRFIGQSDVALSDLGRLQAAALAERLIELPVARIVTSDLSRARETIQPAADRLGLGIEVDPRLREISNGAWTNLLPEEIEEGWPDLWAAYSSGEDVQRPGGERWIDVRARTVLAIEDLVAASQAGDVVVASTHGGPALHAVRWAAGLPADGNIFRGALGPLLNCSLNTLQFPGPHLVGFNDVGHLDGASTAPGRPFSLPR